MGLQSFPEERLEESVKSERYSLLLRSSTLKWGEEEEGRSGFLVSYFSVHPSSFLLWGSGDR